MSIAGKILVSEANEGSSERVSDGAEKRSRLGRCVAVGGAVTVLGGRVGMPGVGPEDEAWRRQAPQRGRDAAE